MKVTAAVLREIGAPLSVDEVELDPPGPGELLVRIGAAGLCHSDLSVINGSRPRPMPMVLGHEAAGEVVEAGPGSSEFAAGDHVVLAFVPACGTCPMCVSGRPALCEPGGAANRAGTLLSGERRWHGAHHHLGVSAFAEYAVVSSRSAVRVDPTLPFGIAALFGCAVLTGAGAAFHSAEVRPGDTVAVFGLGGVGLSALLGAKAAGAAHIIAIDPVESKRALAVRLGAAEVFASAADAAQAVRVDKAIDTTGSEIALAHAYSATRVGGVTVTVGLPRPDRMLTLPALSLVAEERTVRGSYLGSSVPRRDIPRFIDLYRAGLLPVDQLVTGELPLADINSGFELLANGTAVRQLVVP